MSLQKSKINDTYINNPYYENNTNNNFSNLDNTDINPPTDKTYVSNTIQNSNYIHEDTNAENLNKNNIYTDSTLKYESDIEDIKEKNYNEQFKENLNEKEKETLEINKNTQSNYHTDLNQFIYENSNNNNLKKSLERSNKYKGVNKEETNLENIFYKNNQKENLNDYNNYKMQSYGNYYDKQDVDLANHNKKMKQTEEMIDGLLNEPKDKLKDFIYDNKYMDDIPYISYKKSIDNKPFNSNNVKDMLVINKNYSDKLGKVEEKSNSIINLDSINEKLIIKENNNEINDKKFTNYVISNKDINIQNMKLNPYCKFLEDTLEQSMNFNCFNNNKKNSQDRTIKNKRDETQQKLLNNMKNIIYDINDRKKETINLKTEKKKTIINNLENITSNNNISYRNRDTEPDLIKKDSNNQNQTEKTYMINNRKNSEENNHYNNTSKGKISYMINNTKDNFFNANNNNLHQDKSLYDKNEISKFFETKKSWRQNKNEILLNTLQREKEKEENIFFNRSTKNNFYDFEKKNVNNVNSSLNTKFNNNIINDSCEENENISINSNENIKEKIKKEDNEIIQTQMHNDYLINNRNYVVNNKKNESHNEEDYDEEEFTKENFDKDFKINQNEYLSENELSSIHQSVKNEDKNNILNDSIKNNKNANNKNNEELIYKVSKNNFFPNPAEINNLKNENPSKINNNNNYYHDLVNNEKNMQSKKPVNENIIGDSNINVINNDNSSDSNYPKKYNNPYLNKHKNNNNDLHPNKVDEIKNENDIDNQDNQDPIKMNKNGPNKEISSNIFNPITEEKNFNNSCDEVIQYPLVSSNEDFYKINPDKNEKINTFNLDFKEFDAPQGDNMIDIREKNLNHDYDEENQNKKIIRNKQLNKNNSKKDSEEKHNINNNINKNKALILDNDNYQKSFGNVLSEKNQNIENYESNKIINNYNNLNKKGNNNNNNISDEEDNNHNNNDYKDKRKIDFEIYDNNDIKDENENIVNRFNLDYDIIGNNIGNNQKIIEYKNLKLNNQEKRYQEGDDSNDLTKFKNKVIEFGNYKNEDE